MAAPTFQGASSGSISSSGIAAQAWVAGHTTDDIGICICGTTDNTTGTHTTPSGFTLATSNPSGWSTGVSTTACQVEVAYKRATSAAEANAAFTTDIGTQYCKHLLLRGCVTGSDPQNITASGTGTATTSISITTGMTTTKTDCLIVLVVACEADTGVPDTTFISAEANSNLTSVTKQNSNQWNTGSGLGLHIFTGELLTAGAVGTWTMTAALSTTFAWWCGAFESTTSSSGGGGGPTLFGRLPLLGVGR